MMIRSIVLTCVLVALSPAARAQNSAGGAGAKVLSIPSGLVAPATVHVNALGLPLADGTCLTARYEWDFGDAPAPYNRLVGWNAAHVYDKPGKYTIRLKIVSESGKTQQHEQLITVKPFGGRTIYVASDGDDRSDGASPARPRRSVWRGLQLAGDNARVLLRRGDKFDVPATMLLRQKNLTLGAYSPPMHDALPWPARLASGALDNPVIRYTGERNYSPIIQSNSRAVDMTIQDITFDSRFTSDLEKTRMPFAISPVGSNTLVRRCAFLNVGDALNANARPRGVLMQDCVAPLATGLRGYLAWIEGTDHVYLGNAAENSTREAVMRIGFSGAQRVLIAHNRLTNIARSGVDKLDIAKNALTVHFGSHIYIAQNVFTSGPVMIGPLGEADGLQYIDQQLHTAVFDGNVLRNSGLRVNHGMAELMIRNNRFWSPNRPAVNVEGFNRQYNRGSRQIAIVHNTALNEGTNGNFLRTGGRIEGIRVLNNLYAAPKLAPGSDATAVVFVGQKDLHGFTIGGNVWPVTRPQHFANGGAFYLWPSWADARGYVRLEAWNALTTVEDAQMDVELDGALRPKKMDQLPLRPPQPGAAFDAGGARRDGNATRPGAWK